MDATSYLALSHIDALTRSLDVTANNLANATTNGFKSSNMMFTDYISRQRGAHGADVEKKISYSQDKSTYQNTLQGEFHATGNPLDLAINGQGYFSVQTPQGIRLTRDGKFQIAGDGTIVNLGGNPLLDAQNNPITLTQEQIAQPLSIASDGTISTDDGIINTINLVTVDDPNSLNSEGDHLFRPTTPLHNVAAREIRQGVLEASNVNAVKETTDLIRLQREYDLNFQLLQKDFTRRLNAIDKITSETSS